MQWLWRLILDGEFVVISRTISPLLEFATVTPHIPELRWCQHPSPPPCCFPRLQWICLAGEAAKCGNRKDQTCVHRYTHAYTHTHSHTHNAHRCPCAGLASRPVISTIGQTPGEDIHDKRATRTGNDSESCTAEQGMQG